VSTNGVQWIDGIAQIALSEGRQKSWPTSFCGAEKFPAPQHGSLATPFKTLKKVQCTPTFCCAATEYFSRLSTPLTRLRHLDAIEWT
jgi:hypothetical protein